MSGSQLIVIKKDEAMSFCVDYKRLKSASEADAYPLPRIDELIDHLGQSNS